MRSAKSTVLRGQRDILHGYEAPLLGRVHTVVHLRYEKILFEGRSFDAATCETGLSVFIYRRSLAQNSTRDFYYLDDIHVDLLNPQTIVEANEQGCEQGMCQFRDFILKE